MHLVEGTEYAWKLFVDLRPSMLILDLACGYGARSASLARQGVEVVAVATHPDAAVVTRKRLDAVRPDAANDRHCVLLADDICRLPLTDACVDLVLLPVDLHACAGGISDPRTLRRSFERASSTQS